MGDNNKEELIRQVVKLAQQIPDRKVKCDGGGWYRFDREGYTYYINSKTAGFNGRGICYYDWPHLIIKKGKMIILDCDEVKSPLRGQLTGLAEVLTTKNHVYSEKIRIKQETKKKEEESRERSKLLEKLKKDG